MVSLTNSPLITGNDDWEYWYFGLVTLFVFVLPTFYLYSQNLLT